VLKEQKEILDPVSIFLIGVSWITFNVQTLRVVDPRKSGKEGRECLIGWQSHPNLLFDKPDLVQ